jgi:hypothetical protein
LLFAIPAVASARALESIVVKTPSKTVQVRATYTVTFSVSCPSGYAAVSGGLSKPALGAYEPMVKPSGPKAYDFRITLSLLNPLRKPAGTVACARGSAGTRVIVRIVRATATVDTAFDTAKRLSCPSGTAPVGAGMDPRGQSLDVLQATATHSGLSYVVRNLDTGGEEAPSIVFHGSCVAAQPGSGQRLEVTRKTIHRLVRSGLHSFSTRCPAGFVGLGTGYLKSRASVLANAASASGGSWSAWIGQGESARVALTLVCGRLVSS